MFNLAVLVRYPTFSYSPITQVNFRLAFPRKLFLSVLINRGYKFMVRGSVKGVVAEED
jgi:hypothetical protein